MRNLHHRLFAAGMIGAALSACDVPLAPTAQTSGMSTGAGAQMSGGVPEPLCQAGCIETDPSPNAPG